MEDRLKRFISQFTPQPDSKFGVKVCPGMDHRDSSQTSQCGMEPGHFQLLKKFVKEDLHLLDSLIWVILGRASTLPIPLIMPIECTQREHIQFCCVG